MSIDSSHFPSETAARPGKPERLFRAAIDAYCALLRPSRAEADRLDDLALPLIGSVSTETLRFAAAALSETHRAPASLVRKLANEPVHISAPLLMRSKILTDIDLIALIGRHGLPHARVIARRVELNPDIRALIETLDLEQSQQKCEAVLPPELPISREIEHCGDFVLTENALNNLGVTTATESESRLLHRPGRLEEARDMLRSMMAPPAPVESPLPSARLTAMAAFLALRDAVLVGQTAAFEDTLSRLGGIDPKQAEAICRDADIAAKLGLLRFLGLSAEQMFLIMVCRQPQHASSGKAASALLKRYGAISYEWSKRFVLALRRERLPYPVNVNRPSEHSHQAFA